MRQAGPKFKISMGYTARFKKKKKKKSANQTQYIAYIKQSAISSNCNSCLAVPSSWYKATLLCFHSPGSPLRCCSPTQERNNLHSPVLLLEMEVHPSRSGGSTQWTYKHISHHAVYAKFSSLHPTFHEVYWVPLFLTISPSVNSTYSIPCLEVTGQQPSCCFAVPVCSSESTHT